MQLFELFNTTKTYPYKMIGPNRALIELPDGVKVNLDLGYNIVFHVGDRKKTLDQQVLATTFSTIAEVISEWMAKNQPAVFQVLPGSSAREKIYRIMVARVLNQHPEYEANEIPISDTSKLVGWKIRRRNEPSNE